MSDYPLSAEALPVALPDLEPVSWLIGDHHNRALFLEELDPERKIITAEILQSATQLEQTTEWDGETLIQCLGCPATTIEAFRELGIKRLRVSNGYLRLLQTLSGLVETAVDHRLLVLGYGALYRRADEDLNRLRSAFMGGEFPAFDYLQLGEVETALDVAAAELDPKKHQDTTTNPFHGLPQVHISTTRLEILTADNLSVLGETVAGRMKAHIDECPGCGPAYKDRLSRIDNAVSLPAQG